MADEKPPTPQEEALAALKQIWRDDGSFDVSAYRVAGGHEGVQRLEEQAASSSDAEAPIFKEAGPRRGALNSTAYLALRSRMFDEDNARRSKK